MKIGFLFPPLSYSVSYFPLVKLSHPRLSAHIFIAHVMNKRFDSEHKAFNGFLWLHLEFMPLPRSLMRSLSNWSRLKLSAQQGGISTQASRCLLEGHHSSRVLHCHARVGQGERASSRLMAGSTLYLQLCTG